MAEENKLNSKKGVVIAASALVLTGAVGGTVYYVNSTGDEQNAPGDGDVVGKETTYDDTDGKDSSLGGDLLDRDDIVAGLDDEDEADVVAIIEDLDREKESTLLAEQDISEDFTGVERDSALVTVRDTDGHSVRNEDAPLTADAGNDIFVGLGDKKEKDVDSNVDGTDAFEQIRPELPVKPEEPGDVGEDNEEGPGEIGDGGKEEEPGEGNEGDKDTGGENGDGGSDGGSEGGDGNTGGGNDGGGSDGGNEGGNEGGGDKPEPQPDPVDVAKDELRVALDRFGTISSRDYTGLSYTNYNLARGEAQREYHTGTTVTGVKIAKDKLEKEYGNLIKVTSLRTLVEEDVVSRNYTNSSYNDYVSVKEEANRTLGYYSATKEDIKDAEDVLKEAKSDLVSIVSLRDEIRGAANLSEEDYTSASWASYVGEVDSSRSILRKDDASKREVREARDVVREAKSDLVNIVPLRDAIQRANALSEVDYVNDTWIPFSYKLYEVKRVLGKEDATKEEITTAVSELKEVQDKLVEYTSIDELSSLYGKVEGYERSDYTGYGWDDFTDYRSLAKNLLDSESGIKYQIHETHEGLVKAENALVSVEYLNKCLERAKELRTEVGIPTYAIKGLDDAIRNAEEVKVNGTSSEVEYAEEKLHEAIGEAEPSLKKHIDTLTGIQSDIKDAESVFKDALGSYEDDKGTLQDIHDRAVDLINKDISAVTLDDVKEFDKLEEDFKTLSSSLDSDVDDLRDVIGTYKDHIEVMFNEVGEIKDNVIAEDFEIIVRDIDVLDGLSERDVELKGIEEALGIDLTFPEGDVKLDLDPIKDKLSGIQDNIGDNNVTFENHISEYEQVSSEISDVHSQIHTLADKNEDDITEEDVNQYINLKEQFNELKTQLDGIITNAESSYGEYAGSIDTLVNEVNELSGYLSSEELSTVLDGITTVEALGSDKAAAKTVLDNLTNGLTVPGTDIKVPEEEIPEELENEEDVTEEESNTKQEDVQEPIEEVEEKEEIETVEESENEEDTEEEEEDETNVADAQED